MLLIAFLPFLVFSSSCIQRADPEKHLIPKGFAGPVIIIYDQKDGNPEKYNDGFRIYEIPENGILRTQFKHPSGWIALGKLQYYYSGKNGLQELTYIERPADVKDDGQIHVFNKESSVGTIRYLVGQLSDGDKHFKNLRSKIDSLFPPQVQ